MDKQSQIINFLESININYQEGDFELQQLEKLIKFEEFDMGKPIILAEQIQKIFLFCWKVMLDNLLENPLSGEIMTLNLYKPNHILGLKSMQANQSLEFATAASKCRFAKISYRTWRKIK